jgi:hypothetical protein
MIECSQMAEVAKWDARHARAAMAWQHLAITSQSKKSSLSSTMQGWQELDVTWVSKVNVLPLTLQGLIAINVAVETPACVHHTLLFREWVCALAFSLPDPYDRLSQRVSNAVRLQELMLIVAECDDRERREGMELTSPCTSCPASITLEVASAWRCEPLPSSSDSAPGSETAAIDTSRRPSPSLRRPAMFISPLCLR